MEKPEDTISLTRRTVLRAAGLGATALTGGLVGASPAQARDAQALSPLELPVMAWRGSADNHIWWCTYNYYDNSWTGPQELTDRRTEFAPAVAANLDTGRRIMVWRGPGADAGIWYSRIPKGGSAWSPQEPVGPAFNTNAAPAISAVPFGDLDATMVWRGSGDNHIWWSVLAGGWEWSAPRRLADRRTDLSPAVTNFNQSAIMAWKGVGTDERIWWSTLDHSKGIWSAQRQVGPAFNTNAAPALAVSYLGVMMVWRGSGDNHIWWSVCNFESRRWTAPRMLADRRTDIGPTVGRLAGPSMVMAWKDAGAGTGIWWSTFNLDNQSWSPQQRADAVFETNAAPVLSNRY